jgi:hypothetical protein
MEELNQEPTKAKESTMDSLWDIDDSTNFENAFDMGAGNPDPLIDFGDTEAKTQEKVQEPKEEPVLGDLDEGSEPTQQPEASQEVEVPELDLDKEPVAEQGEDTNEDPIHVFAKMLEGKDILDLNEDFNPTEEGLLEAVETTVENRVKEELELFNGGLPKEGKDLLRHLMNGGQVSDFIDTYSQFNYNEVNVKANKTNQKYVLTEFMKLRGDAPEEIAENLELYEDSGLLESKALRAQERLAAYQEQQKQQFAAKQEEANRAKEQQRQEVVSNIQEKISTVEELKGIPLSKKVKKQLLSYMTVPSVRSTAPDGTVKYVTQFQADESKNSNDLDEFILKAYLRMTDYDLSSAKKRTVSDFSSKLRNSLQNKKEMTGTHAKVGGNKKTSNSGSAFDWNV